MKNSSPPAEHSGSSSSTGTTAKAKRSSCQQPCPSPRNLAEHYAAETVLVGFLLCLVHPAFDAREVQTLKPLPTSTLVLPPHGFPASSTRRLLGTRIGSNWIACNSCNALLCHDCCKYPRSGYCDEGINRYGLFDCLVNLGLINLGLGCVP